MTLQLLFVGLALACVAGAAVLLLLVLVRRGRGGRDLALAALLITRSDALYPRPVFTRDEVRLTTLSACAG
jgi:hypothetical protein